MNAFEKGISSLSSSNSVEERNGKDRMKVESYGRQNEVK